MACSQETPGAISLKENDNYFSKTRNFLQTKFTMAEEMSKERWATVLGTPKDATSQTGRISPMEKLRKERMVKRETSLELL